jgi:L-ascorbate 6-phosphate lactonase
VNDDVRLTWLGQAGFAIAGPNGALCLVDPYLSDSLAEDANVPRIAPLVLDSSTTRATVAVASHWHQDHLDPVTSKALHRANADCMFVGPPANVDRLVTWWRIPANRTATLRRGETVSIPPFTIRGCHARHEVPGWVCEDAISILIEAGGRRIYHSGDTEYDPLLRNASAFGPIDVGLFAINGTGGNMNAYEAAVLAFQLKPRLAIPMHYGMWAPDKYGGVADGDSLPPDPGPGYLR